MHTIYHFLQVWGFGIRGLSLLNQKSVCHCRSHTIEQSSSMALDQKATMSGSPSLVNKQPVNIWLKQTGSLRSLRLCPWLVDQRKCQSHLRSPCGDLNIAELWTNLDTIPESSMVNSFSLYWIMLWIRNVGHSRECTLMFLRENFIIE